MDSSGHGYGSRSANLERKLIDSEKLIRAIMEKMDDKTTLIIFGDHGMTEDGNHGGNTDVELATVFFAYQKQPFPMYESYSQHQDVFYNLDHSVKLGDVAAIVSSILDIPFPFSNMGNMHPLFAQSGDLKRVHEKFIENLDQINNYFIEYCRVTT